MINRLKTSKEAKERLERLNNYLKLSNNAIIMRFALAKSISHDVDIEEDKDAIVNDNYGFEISRQTLFNENETLFKILMNCLNEDDEKFFPYLTNKHIERGLKILEREYKFAGNKEKFIINLINKIN